MSVSTQFVRNYFPLTPPEDETKTLVRFSPHTKVFGTIWLSEFLSMVLRLVLYALDSFRMVKFRLAVTCLELDRAKGAFSVGRKGMT